VPATAITSVVAVRLKAGEKIGEKNDEQPTDVRSVWRISCPIPEAPLTIPRQILYKVNRLP
jgi:hypothetical protein